MKKHKAGGRRRGKAVPDNKKGVEFQKAPSVTAQLAHVVKSYDPELHSEAGKEYNAQRTRAIRINAKKKGIYNTEDLARHVVEAVLILLLLVPGIMTVFSMGARLRRIYDMFELTWMATLALGTVAALWWYSTLSWWFGALTWQWLVVEWFVAALVPFFFLSWSPLAGGLWWLTVLIAGWHVTMPYPLTPPMLWFIDLFHSAVQFHSEPVEVPEHMQWQFQPMGAAQ